MTCPHRSQRIVTRDGRRLQICQTCGATLAVLAPAGAERVGLAEPHSGHGKGTTAAQVVGASTLTHANAACGGRA